MNLSFKYKRKIDFRKHHSYQRTRMADSFLMMFWFFYTINVNVSKYSFALPTNNEETALCAVHFYCAQFAHSLSFINERFFFSFSESKNDWKKLHTTSKCMGFKNLSNVFYYAIINTYSCVFSIYNNWQVFFLCLLILLNRSLEWIFNSMCYTGWLHVNRTSAW